MEGADGDGRSGVGLCFPRGKKQKSEVMYGRRGRSRETESDMGGTSDTGIAVIVDTA